MAALLPARGQVAVRELGGVVYLVRAETAIVEVSVAQSIEQAALQYAHAMFGPAVHVRRLTGRPTRAGYFQAYRTAAGRDVPLGQRFHVSVHVGP